MRIGPPVRSAIAALALAPLAQAATGASPEPARPDQVAVESLDPLTQLDIGLTDRAQRDALPGFAAVVVRDGRVVWSRAWGRADTSTNAPMGLDTPIQVASLTKPLAATAVLELAASGRLSLDDPASDYPMPRSVSNIASHARSGATLRNLLSHTSGATHNRPASEEFVYDGDAYSDLTWVIEQAAGEPYAQALRALVLAPTGMRDSIPGPWDDPSGHIRARAARLHLAMPDGTPVPIPQTVLSDRDEDQPLQGSPDPATRWVPYGREDVPATRARTLGPNPPPVNGAFAAVGLTTSAADLARFDIALDDGTLVDAPARQAMFTPARLADGSPAPYGLGWFLTEIDGEPVAWHYGHTTGCSGLYIKLLRARTTLILISNGEGISKAWTNDLAEGRLEASPYAQLFINLFTARTAAARSAHSAPAAG